MKTISVRLDEKTYNKLNYLMNSESKSTTETIKALIDSEWEFANYCHLRDRIENDPEFIKELKKRVQ